MKSCVMRNLYFGGQLQTFKLLAFLALLFLLLGMDSGSIKVYAIESGSLNIQYHSKEEIRQFIEAHPVQYLTDQYTSKPGGTNPGVLSGDVDQDALNAINQIRYIAGLSADITIDPNQEKMSQAAAYVNYTNGYIDHYPSRPVGWGSEYDNVYDLGYQGAQSSNLDSAYGADLSSLGYEYANSLASTVIFGWMADETGYNMRSVGHRRWIINPYMTTTGFGQVERYKAMYSFGSNDDEYFNHKQLVSVWPAPNMPINYFKNNEPWSYSNGVSETGDVKVVLTRTNTGQTWNFSKYEADGYFNIDNSYCGLSGCVIFRPDSISYSAGDRFTIDITGLKGGNVSYSVEFFDLDLSETRDRSEGENDNGKFYWEIINGKSYWYEDNVRQGTATDTKCFEYDETLRGREIYDPKSDGWYWLDVINDGAKAVGKEVFMPYIYQNEAEWKDNDNELDINATASGAYAEGNYEHAELADQVRRAIQNGTGKWVRYDNEGKMMKGWVTIEGDLAALYPDQAGNRYYYDRKTGLMAKGATVIDGIEYYFDETTGVLR